MRNSYARYGWDSIGFVLRQSYLAQNHPRKISRKKGYLTSAISFMNEHVTRMKNTLEWYCIDN